MTLNPFAEPGFDPGIDAISVMLDGVLNSVVNTYAQAGVDLPERRYWTFGEIVADCQQVVVSLQQAYIGPPGDEAGAPVRCDGPRSAAVTVQVVRCAPTGTQSSRSTFRPPTPEQIIAANKEVAIDAWLLLDSASSLDQWDPAGGTGLGVIATVDVIPAQGGYHGITLNLTLAIP